MHAIQIYKKVQEGLERPEKEKASYTTHNNNGVPVTTAQNTARTAISSPSGINARMREQVLQAIPYTPLDMSGLEHNPAFLSDDAELVRASLKLQILGFRRGGAMPSRFDMLAVLLGLSQEKLTLHFADLAQGWELGDDGQLHHAGLAAASDDMFAKYEPQMKEWHVAAIAYAATVGIEFEALKPTAKKGNVSASMKKAMTFEDFSNLDVIHKNFEQAGIIDDRDREWVLEQFNNYHLSDKSIKRSDWDATFRTWIGRVRPHELPSVRLAQNRGNGATGGAGVSGIQNPFNSRARNPSRYGEAGKANADNNVDMFNRLMQQQGHPQGHPQGQSGPAGNSR